MGQEVAMRCRKGGGVPSCLFHEVISLTEEEERTSISPFPSLINMNTVTPRISFPVARGRGEPERWVILAQASHGPCARESNPKQICSGICNTVGLPPRIVSSGSQGVAFML